MNIARSSLDAIGDYSNSDEEIDEEMPQVAVPEPAEVVPANRPSFVKSKKEKHVLNQDGWLYWKNRQYKETTYWECTKVDEEGCRARLNTKNGLVVKTSGQHTHDKSALALPLRNLQNAIKQKALDTMEKPSRIFNSMLPGVPDALQAKLDKSATRLVVQRKRKVTNHAPAPGHAMIFEIPDAYKKYKSGHNGEELFLLADEINENGKRILLFGRASNKSWSGRMKVVFIDGTFKITPPPFFQVYVVLAERDGYVFPVLYGLLPDKTQATYESLFKMIKKIWPEFAPSSFSVDYEMAVINALEVVFGESEIFGCLFHLVQNLKKHLAFYHLKGRYETDPDFAVKCRMITAMAFVRPDEVMPVFEELEELLLGEIALDPILAWFKKTYIGNENRRGIMSPPLFAHSIWNVYDRTLNGDHRTNNFAEAANHRIQTELDVSHPGLWTFIKCLQSVQQGRDQKYLQWMAGKEPKGKRQKYKQADARILRIVQDYQERETKEYLKGIAHNFVMED